MGSAGLRELLAKSDRFDVVVLALPTANDKKILAPYDGKIKIVWGDLTNYDNVLEGVNGADYVLHVGGMVSPKADYFPQTTLIASMLLLHKISFGLSWRNPSIDNQKLFISALWLNSALVTNPSIGGVLAILYKLVSTIIMLSVKPLLNALLLNRVLKNG